MNKKLIITIGAIVGVIFLGFGIYQTTASQADPKLSSEEIQEMVENQYPGEIKAIELEKDVYAVEIEGGDKEYELQLDADTGEVLKLDEQFIDKAKVDLEDDQNNDEQEENTENNQSDEQEDQNDQQEKDQNKKTDDHHNDQKIMDPKKAIDMALSEFSGTVKEIELEKEDGRLVYEVEIMSGFEEAEIEIDVYTEEIVQNKTKQKDKKLEEEPGISAKKAIDIALNEYSGIIDEVELEKEDGRLIYEVELKSDGEEAEIDIDAYTGEVLVIEIDAD